MTGPHQVNVWPGQLVVGLERLVGRQAEGGEVEGERRLLHAGRVEVDDAQHHVAAVVAALGVGDDLLVVGAVEAQVAQPLQRRVAAADVVEPGDERRQRVGGIPVAAA